MAEKQIFRPPRQLQRNDPSRRPTAPVSSARSNHRSVAIAVHSSVAEQPRNRQPEIRRLCLARQVRPAVCNGKDRTGPIKQGAYLASLSLSFFPDRDGSYLSQLDF